MVEFSDDVFAWSNVRLVCVECLETTWKRGERLHLFHHQEQKLGFNKHVRWWSCRKCW